LLTYERIFLARARGLIGMPAHARGRGSGGRVRSPAPKSANFVFLRDDQAPTKRPHRALKTTDHERGGHYVSSATLGRLLARLRSRRAIVEQPE
jgi:hypothetical protein